MNRVPSTGLWAPLWIRNSQNKNDFVQDLKRTVIELKIEGDVAVIELVPPKGKPPTLDEEVLQQLDMSLNEIEEASVKLTYLRSASSKYFCVGANIGVLKELSADTIGEWVTYGNEVLNRLEDLPCPVVAMVSGYAMGGGLEIAMACDLIVAENEAKFSQSEAKLGFIPGWGGCRRLVDRVGISKAKYLFFTGKLLDGRSALECGLIDFSGTDKELVEFTSIFSQSVLENNYNAVSTFKRVLNGEQRARRDRNTEAEAINSKSCLKDEDTLKRLDDFLNKRG